MKRHLAAYFPVFAILLVAGGALLLLAKYLQQRTAPSSDRQHSQVQFSTPYRNVQPEVQYVGDETCCQCHQEQAETYRRHPMGRSFAPMSEAVPVERYGPAGLHPFEKSGFKFQVERRGTRVF